MVHHGTTTSLYQSVSPEVVKILEDAILTTRAKLSKRAEEAFSVALAAYCHVPVVALEHANFLIQGNRFSRALAALDKVPQDAFTDSKEDRQVQQLFAIFRATVRIQTEGIHEPALEEMRSLQRAWAIKSVDSYTDIEVECVSKYVLACSFLSSSPGCITKDFKLFPTARPAATPVREWRGLQDLRYSLWRQRRFMEATKLDLAKRTMYPTQYRYHLTVSFLELVRDHREQMTDAEDKVPWSAAILQLKDDLVGLSADLGAKQTLKHWLASLEIDIADIITTLNGESGSLDVSESLDTMTIEYHRLRLAGNKNPTKAQFQQILNLSERMVEESHSKAQACHDLTLTWAKHLYLGDECKVICTDVQFRMQHFLGVVQGRMTAAVTNLVDIVSPRSTDVNEVTKSIATIEAFVQRHPSVGLPTALPEIRKQLRILDFLYHHSGGRTELKPNKASEAAKEPRTPLPAAWSFRRIKPGSIIEETSLRVKHFLDRQIEHESVDLELDMTGGYLREPLDVRTPKLLQQLLIEELTSRGRYEDKFGLIFRVEESDESSVRRYLTHLNQTETLQSLVGTPDNPVRKAEWTERSRYLKMWLLDDSRPRLSVRQCLWVDIHTFLSNTWSIRRKEAKFHQEFSNTRERNPANFKCMSKAWALGAVEETFENLSAMEDRLQLTEARLGCYDMYYEKEAFKIEGMLPKLCVDLFFYSEVLDVYSREQRISGLDYGEEVARRQLIHARSVKDYQTIAQSAIMIASITQYKIESRIISETTTINRALEEALDLLEETESLFGTTLYESDLSHICITSETKPQVENKEGTWTIGCTAIRLLTHAIQAIEKESSDSRQDLVLALWQWVQRAKGRALAQSLGLDKSVPDSILAAVQDSVDEESSGVQATLAISSDKNGYDDESHVAAALRSIQLEGVSALPLSFLPEVRRILKRNKLGMFHNRCDVRIGVCPSEMIPHAIREYIHPMWQDLEYAGTNQIRGQYVEQNRVSDESIARANERIALRPALARLVNIANLLDRSEEVQKSIDESSAADPHWSRMQLRRLRKEMQEEPILARMLQIREGWAVSPDELHRIAASREGKVVFVDWFRLTSSFNQSDKIYMILWRNGSCKLIDLETEFKKTWQKIVQFFDMKDKDGFLPDVDVTPMEKWDWIAFEPIEVNVDNTDIRLVENYMELVQPLFDDPLVERGDLLVLSVTDGLHNFPLHAIEDGYHGPLILNHPIVYVPSLSVLHKCFQAQNSSNGMSPTANTELRPLILGGINSEEEVYRYGNDIAEKIGEILNCSQMTFSGPRATLENFTTHYPTSNLFHLHLHTNYGSTAEEAEAAVADDSQQPSTPPRAYFSSPSTPTQEELIVTHSPLNQAIRFYREPASSSTALSSAPNPTNAHQEQQQHTLTAQQILALALSPGTNGGPHINHIPVARTVHQRFSLPSPFLHLVHGLIEEAKGLTPAFPFAGAGSVGSALWPVLDEHGGVFSVMFFRELMRVREEILEAKKKKKGKEGEKKKGKGKEVENEWIDLADVHRAAVLEMRRLYRQPSAWAGFVLNGCWKF